MAASTQRYFFLDTNFLIDFPDFYRDILFDDQPYTLVLCSIVQDELERKSKSGPTRKTKPEEGSEEEQRNKVAFLARKAIRSIEGLQTGRISRLPFCRLTYLEAPVDRKQEPDDQILHLAKRFARYHRQCTVILFSGDKPFAIRSRFKGLEAVNPQEWHQAQQLAVNARPYSDAELNTYCRDPRVWRAYQARYGAEAALFNYSAQSTRPWDPKWNLLCSRWSEAMTEERLAVESYRQEADNQINSIQGAAPVHAGTSHGRSIAIVLLFILLSLGVAASPLFCLLFVVLAH